MNIKLNIPGKEWICTDPDNNQYGRQLSFTHFEFKESRKIDDFLSEDVRMEIDLSDYDTEEVEKYIRSYYPSLDELFKIYGKQSNWIIAECIFEMENGLY